MSFQYMIDNAQTVEYNMRPQVSQTISRGGAIRSVDRGNDIWRFTVTMPSGARYSDYREALAGMEAQGQTQEINIDFAEYDYLFGYQGDLATPSITVTRPLNGTGSQTTLAFTQGAFNPGGTYTCKKGDIIKLDNHIYQMEQDVTSSYIYLNRPYIFLETSPGYGTTTTGTFGASNTFRVKCIQMPTYQVFGYDQIAWSGPFVFQETFD